MEGCEKFQLGVLNDLPTYYIYVNYMKSDKIMSTILYLYYMLHI